MKNLEGKGYPRFPEPLKKENLDFRLREIKDWSERTVQALNIFKARQTPESANTCLHYFNTTMRVLEKYLEHPADIDYVLADEGFFKGFSSIVGDIKNLHIVKVVKDH